MAMYKYIVMVGFEFVDIECKHFFYSSNLCSQED